MAKRFTDTEKWKKKFIKGLSTVHKLFFFYLLDDCNHAGIWHIEPEIASIRIGEDVDIEKAKKELGKHIIEIDGGEKWFIPYFVEFQYGELNPKVNAHKSVIAILKKHKIKGFINSSQTVMDKDMDKDKDINIPFEKFWKAYDYKKAKPDCELFWNSHKKLKSGKFMNDKDRVDIVKHLDNYIKNTNKDGTYPTRKHPRTYLYNSSWHDEIITSSQQHSEFTEEC